MSEGGRRHCHDDPDGSGGRTGSRGRGRIAPVPGALAAALLLKVAVALHAVAFLKLFTACHVAAAAVHAPRNVRVHYFDSDLSAEDGGPVGAGFALLVVGTVGVIGLECVTSAVIEGTLETVDSLT